MSDNAVLILIAIISPVIAGLFSVLVEIVKIRYAPPRSPDLKTEPDKKDTTPKESSRLSRAFVFGVVIGIMIVVVVSIAIVIFLGGSGPGAPTAKPSPAIHPTETLPAELILWSFDGGKDAWQCEPPNPQKPEIALSNVIWDQETLSLRTQVDFSNVKHDALTGGIKPRATCYIDNINNDWTPYKILRIDVKHLTKHDFEVTFSIKSNGCWNEYGGYQNLAASQTSTLSFNLIDPKYKTCKFSDDFKYLSTTFDNVQRFDIIIGVKEDPWDQVKGYILIDNIRLTNTK